MTHSTFQKISIFIIVLLFLGVTATDVQAQEDFEKWKQSYLNEFQDFQNEYDKQFHEMLKKEWKKFNIELSPDFYEKPKPAVIPRVEKPESSKPKTTVTLEKPQDEKTQETKPEPKDEPQIKEADRDTKKESRQKAGERFDEHETTEPMPSEKEINPTFEPKVKKAKVQSEKLSYFDVPVRYKYYAAYKTRVPHPVDKKAISGFWKHLSTKDYPSFLEQIRKISSQLSLNDYGYAQLLDKIGEQIYGEDSHEATLFTWFMLTQSGFGTRIAYNNENVYLLIKTSPGVFRTTYFTINGSKYYGLSFSESYSQLPDQLYTYEADYPNSKERELNLLFDKLPALPREQENRTLSFSYKDTAYTFEVPVDQRIVTYFKNYPKADLNLYFNSRMEGETHKKLISSLRPLLEDKSHVEKINILLRFIQESFDYQTDQDQFNTEKKMFPDEALYYPANDCDDRSILFAYLVEHLTDLQYIVLRYPGHLTPAVHFPSNPPSGAEVGRPITYNGKPYYVTDPTYIGADAGMVMPDYQNMRPEEIYDL